jgi:hypothetical protein
MNTNTHTHTYTHTYPFFAPGVVVFFGHPMCKSTTFTQKVQLLSVKVQLKHKKYNLNTNSTT